jgi:hypothetical protein
MPGVEMSGQQPAVGNRQSFEWRWVALAAAGVALLSSVPYLVVALTTPPDLRFGGALVNPIDGQSYFAKMRQGYDGAWLFRLPFTAGDEADAFLFTFHLALGHLARITGLSLAATYQAARFLGGWALLLVVYVLISRVFDSVAERRWAWAFVALTSGLGWLRASATDLTIPESNTFFSILANAHFALAAALMVVVLVSVLDGSWRRAAPAAIGLAILQPFAPLAVFAALGVYLPVRWLRPSPLTSLPEAEARRAFPVRPALAGVVTGLSVAPLMAYFYVATQRDPILQGWSAQNLTPSPPPIEYLAGYGLMALLAIPGLRAAWRRGRDVDLLLAAWAISSALLLYTPFPLQRRFSLGLHIPIALLGMLGLLHVLAPQLRRRAARWLPRVAFALSLPSTLLLLIATSSAALQRLPDARLFFFADESAAFDWLRDHAARDSVVLAAPETGLFLPAWADVRVLYGHPYETLNGERMRSLLEAFLSGAIDREAIIREYRVDYIFFGPHEARLGQPEAKWEAVFDSGDVTVYRVP